MNINKLFNREFHIALNVSETYFSKENGNFYAKKNIDRKAICTIRDPCILTFDTFVELCIDCF